MSSPFPIDRCMCGAVQGFFYWKGATPPFKGKGQGGVHSPVGCFRQGGDEVQTWRLYIEATGEAPAYGVSYWVQLQVVFTWLQRTPDRARTLPVVLSPTPLIPPRAYETPSPARLPGVRGTGGRGGAPHTPARLPVVWDPVANPVKPPWEK